MLGSTFFLPNKEIIAGNSLAEALMAEARVNARTLNSTGVLLRERGAFIITIIRLHAGAGEYFLLVPSLRHKKAAPWCGARLWKLAQLTEQ
jgi:hypothetical protein